MVYRRRTCGHLFAQAQMRSDREIVREVNAFAWRYEIAQASCPLQSLLRDKRRQVDYFHQLLLREPLEHFAAQPQLDRAAIKLRATGMMVGIPLKPH